MTPDGMWSILACRHVRKKARKEGHAAMIRAWRSADVAACRVVSNPAWCRIFNGHFSCVARVAAHSRFYCSSDFDLAQHFSCSVKTVECDQKVLLACRQLRKKAQHNFIGQLKNVLNLPSNCRHA